MTNNDIMKKLRVALKLRNDQLFRNSLNGLIIYKRGVKENPK